MASTETPTSIAYGEPWLSLLDDESDHDYNPTRNELVQILGDFLLSGQGTAMAAEKAASRIDHFYSDTFLPRHVLAKLEDDKGMGYYLEMFYEVMFELVKLVPYNDPRQDQLVKLIVELRKLPPKQFTINDAKCLVYADEPIFFIAQDDRWNNDFPYPIEFERLDPIALQELCDHWVNHQAFTARCFEAGINSQGSLKYPSEGLENGLEKALPTQRERDCKVMVAAQYILLAGSTIHRLSLQASKGNGDEMVKWYTEKWPLWAAKLKDIEEKGDCAPEVIAAVSEARKKLLTL